MLVKHNIYLEKETLTRIKKLAKKQNISMSEYVRRIMKKVLQRRRKVVAEAFIF